ncbi:MAG: phosphoribosylamine--glycine ligase [Deltaproteobacteria bacterium]|nr:phosphoribosylamine--glycine ligase [Deltaproteobacteria bacterium]
MRVLLIGNGGREHALLWRFRHDAPQAELHVTPGNAGMEAWATRHDVAVDDSPGILQLALRIQADLVVAGPEAALAAGTADLLGTQGIPVFGPPEHAARLETSKLFAKEVMASCGVLTARHWQVDDEADLREAVAGGARVLKADGLASGKGVVVTATAEAALEAGRLWLKRFGAPVVAEELLPGREVSVMALCDGTRALMLPSAQDHKRLQDGDRGPNTGGMGTVSPGTHHGRLGMDEPTLLRRTQEEVIAPVLAEMRAREVPFVGVLFAGLMVEPETGKIRVLEFNARLGDPETQVVVRRLDGSLLEAMRACAAGNASRVRLGIRPEAAACVVLAADGYPDAPRHGDPIEGLEEAGALEAVTVFHAGTARSPEGRVVVRGGRVLGVCAAGGSEAQALERAYSASALIRWPGVQYRRDLGRTGA